MALAQRAGLADLVSSTLTLKAIGGVNAPKGPGAGRGDGGLGGLDRRYGSAAPWWDGPVVHRDPGPVHVDDTIKATHGPRARACGGARRGGPRFSMTVRMNRTVATAILGDRGNSAWTRSTTRTRSGTKTNNAWSPTLRLPRSPSPPYTSRRKADYISARLIVREYHRALRLLQPPRGFLRSTRTVLSAPRDPQLPRTFDRR
jgi:hypothetical protein